MALVKCNASFSYQTASGPRTIAAGELLDESDPAVSARRAFFTPTAAQQLVTAAELDPGAAASLAADPAFTGTYSRFEMPEASGAAAAYSGSVDDTAALQAAITAAVASGRPVRLNRIYNCPTGGLTASGPVTIIGGGGSFTGDPIDSTTPTALTGIRCASGTASALTLNGAGNTLRDFAVFNDVSVAPTSGVGINFTDCSQTFMSGVTVQAFYRNVQTFGVFWTFQNCHFYDAVDASVYLDNGVGSYTDHGDLGINNCVFAQNYKTWDCASGLYWRSGGGLRIVGNKFLGGAAVGITAGKFGTCINLKAANSTSTGDIIIAANSISNFTVAGINCGHEYTGTGTAGFILYGNITNNEINVGFSGSSAITVGAYNTAARNSIKNILISDNTFDNVPKGISAYNLNGLTVGINHWSSNVTGPLVTLADGTDDGTGTQGVEIARQGTGTLTGTDYIYDKRKLTSSDVMTGTVDHSWTTKLYANVVGTWVTLGYIDLPVTNGGTASLEVLITGYDFAVGPIYARYQKVLTKASGTRAVTVADEVADFTAGAGSHYAVQFVTTTNDRVIIQVQLTTGSATIWGKARITPRGDIERSHRGA